MTSICRKANCRIWRRSSWGTKSTRTEKKHNFSTNCWNSPTWRPWGKDLRTSADEFRTRRKGLNPVFRLLRLWNSMGGKFNNSNTKFKNLSTVRRKIKIKLVVMRDKFNRLKFSFNRQISDMKKFKHSMIS